MKKEFRFPSILGILFLLLSVGIGVYFNQKRTTTGSKASGTCRPDNIQVTNITDKSANISFVTENKCLATIGINNQTLTDIKAEAGKVHYFEAKNLKPQSDYSFTIISGDSSYDQETNKFKTGTTPSATTPNARLAWGKVFAPDGKTPASAIVYLNIPGSQPLSSLVTSNGNWSVSLATSFNEAKNDWFIPSDEEIDEEIIVIADDGSVTQLSSTTAHNNPVPNITIGNNNLDFPELDITESEVGQFDPGDPISASKYLEILNPGNGETINVSQPDFFGNAPVNTTVIIEIHSDQVINGQAVSDQSGQWHWSPPQGLSPGQHTITVKVQNATTGLWESATRQFVVLAADDTSGPQYEASGSATTPTQIPTQIPSQAPTSVIPSSSPTLAPTVAPTDLPEPTTRVSRPSVSVTPPVSGNLAPTVLIIVCSLIFVLISIKII